MTVKRIQPPATACALALAIFALAATEAQAQLEEVVVTAQKREQSLQDVGISATAFNEEAIEAMSLKNIGDALSFAPNIQRTYGPSASQDGFFFFRGVGQQDVLVVVDPGVAVYVDDVYLGRLQGASFDVLDIQRIELLRGPQGTLFGRNTVGGAVSVHTSDPAEELGFKGRVTGGERDRVEFYGTLDGPLTDTLRASVSLYSKQQDGWVTNSDGTTLGDTDTQGGRVKFLWEALDSLTLRLTADYSDSGGTATPQMLVGFNESKGLGPLAVILPFDMGDDIVRDPFGGRADLSADPTLDSKRSGESLVADWDAGPFAVKSITAFRQMEQATFTDLDGGPYSVYDTQFTYDQDQFSQELQLTGTAFEDRLTWMLGGYYFHEDVTGFTGICIGTGHVGPFMPRPNPLDQLYPGYWENGDLPVRHDDRCFKLASGVNLKVDAYATFGNFEYKLTDQLTGLLGVRYTAETKDQTYNTATDNRDGVYSDLYSLPGVVEAHPFALPGELLYDVSANNPNLTVPYRYEKTWYDFSPKFGLNYALTDSTLVYASWSRGFKSGGFGGRNAPGDPFEPYDPETIESWETGFKMELFDQRMRLNAAAFFSNYDDVQLLVIADVQGGENLFITANGGEAEIKGFEVEMQALPIDALDISLGVGYIDSKWKKLDALTSDIPLDGRLPQTPEWTVSSALRYTFGLGTFGELTVGGDYSYRTDFYFDPENLAEQEAHDIVNLRATLRPDGGRYSFSLYGLNVLNEEYFYTKDDNLSGLGTSTVVPAPSSEWGVEFTVDFR